MKIKLQKPITDYKYLLMFDLASHVSGVCLWDLTEQKPIQTYVIKVENDTELQVAELYQCLDNFFWQLEHNNHIDLNQVLVYKEAMPVQLHGGNSTVQTFISLARSHSILDYYIYSHGIDIYDYVGVYPISTHSYLKKINNWDNKHKVVKTDIKDFVENTYQLESLSFDEADSVFLAKTFLDVKWNKDIDEEIKAIKRHSKELKSERGVNTCLNEIKRLEGLKISLE